MLEDSLGDSDEHHGSRSNKRANDRDDLEDMTTKKIKADSYDIALQKAREQTKYSNMLDEEYEGIQRAIENQRRAAQTKKPTNVEDIVNQFIETKETAHKPLDPTKDILVLSSFPKKPTDGEMISKNLSGIQVFLHEFK